MDHPEGTQLGITENNAMVLYSIAGVVSTDTANFNDKTDITDNIQYGSNNRSAPIGGDTLDHAYVHYPSNTFYNLALITKMDYDGDAVINKNYAADVICNTSSGNLSTSLAMRELSHEVIIPFSALTLFGINVYDAQLTYQRHFSTRYIALAELSAVNTYYEAPLYSAELSNVGDITSFMNETDQLYGEMDSLSTISLTFEIDDDIAPLGDGYIRDYVFVCTGRYISENPNDNEDNYCIMNNNSDKLTTQNNPLTYKLYTNYPNPFNPVTQIKYDLKNNTNVKIGIYNITGQLVKELVNGYKEAGTYSTMFDATNFASGIYFYKMEAGDFVESKKMVVINGFQSVKRVVHTAPLFHKKNFIF